MAKRIFYTRKEQRKMTVILVSILIILLIIVGIILLFTSNKKEETVTKGKLVSRFSYPVLVKEGIYPDNVYGTPVHTQLIPENTDARPMTKRMILYIVIHETDNFEYGVGAKNHATYLSYNNTSSTSWHYTVDDYEIYHHIPDDEVAHHAGEATGNQHGIGIELCVNEDGNFNKTFENGAKLVAYLLKAYDLTIDEVLMHRDFNGKDCPHRIIANNRWDEFKERITYYLNQ